MGFRTAAPLLAAILALAAAASSARAASDCPPLLAHSAPRLQDEAPQNLCQYAGRVLLVVNTASFCGYTSSQYEGLEALHARYASRGLVVLGFPSNDFNQEPADNKSIADFCFNTYGVKFPMFAKTSVVGQTAHPFFAALARASGQAPKWNFHKYLIDRDGRVVEQFASAVAPLDRKLTQRIEQLLAARAAASR
ncbi:MAG: glutathione peroxidase [Burkholderiaceae bacterium]